MKLLLKFNLILLIIFGTGGLLIAQFAYSFLFGNARREVLQEAQLMMASANSVRDYTANDLSPLLQQNPRHRVRFLAETIPFYAATTTFNNLRKNYPDYTYKEAALNPTNPKTVPRTGMPISSTTFATIPTRRKKSVSARLPMVPRFTLPNPLW
jgi:hypothetical protein